MATEGAIYDIYSIINKVDGKMYIGQTKNGYRTRFEQHKRPSDGSPSLRRAMALYGADKFECELLDLAYTREAANLKERAWIGALKTTDPEIGYNLTTGGVLTEMTPEVARKMSEARKGKNNSFYGKHHTPEQIAKWKAARKGRYHRGAHPKAKAVRCVETGKVYACEKDAAEDTGACVHHIGQVADKRYGRKTTGGFHWEWVE